MGTNYYWYKTPACDCCKREDPPLHIGKSSYGWCFSLRVYPEDNIKTLDDWNVLLAKQGSYIRDEYGDEISAQELLKTITERSGKTPWNSRDYTNSGWYKGEEDFHYKNHSERGPKFLLRHKVDGVHCVWHGEGTYDYLIGEFL